MADRDRRDDGPSLEMPSLGSLFKRGRKQQPQTTDDAPSAEDFERLVRGKPATEPTAAQPEEPTAEAPTEAAEPTPSTPAEPTEAAESAAPEAATDTSADEAPDKTAAVTDDAVLTEPLATAGEAGSVAPADRATSAAEPLATAVEAESTPGPGRAEDPAAERQPEAQEAVSSEPAGAESTPQLAGAAPAPGADTSTQALPELPEHDLIVAEEEADLADLEDDDLDFEEEPRETTPRRTLADLRLPALPDPAAAAITGAIVGILAVGLTYFGLQGCEAVKGTSACGGPGIPILIAIMVVLVAVGSVLLAAWQITDPTSTSFLAVGLLAVIALLFLINVIFSPAMGIVIPLVSVGTYLLSQFVTARFIDEA
ncbi:hypothetical protein [Nocardioides daejeonensis]|uniref:hypothetical protein n=1 Tax=Nocardioides daejeonensis TaxID=1046556 RepID=UPI0013A5A6BF|nr:hypothetical protein [Nocardioides daejeonensis]